ncbi:hypothetical protein K438DRAFT_1763783 [Mycena galopus ATCC 62051]|nr:hypothetical protein K438DRAFT_1763783 [Mycena galopus ATCC 62051]
MACTRRVPRSGNVEVIHTAGSSRGASVSAKPKEMHWEALGRTGIIMPEHSKSVLMCARFWPKISLLFHQLSVWKYPQFPNREIFEEKKTFFLKFPFLGNITREYDAFATPFSTVEKFSVPAVISHRQDSTRICEACGVSSCTVQRAKERNERSKIEDHERKSTIDSERADSTKRFLHQERSLVGGGPRKDHNSGNETAHSKVVSHLESFRDRNPAQTDPGRQAQNLKAQLRILKLAGPCHAQ